MRALTALVAFGALSGCHILFPEDPRLGKENADECASRVAGLLGPGTSYHDYTEASGLPIFTYDITKLGFEEIQGFMVAGSDDTAGARLMNETNETSTAVARFMASNVDDKGAFFMGRDPALYRVKGERQAKPTMIASGCARQSADMRLIMVDIVPDAPEPDPQNEDPDDTGSDNQNPNETPEGL